MVKFEEIQQNAYILKSPYSQAWSGVFLLRGTENILIDSGASGDVIDDCIIPALAELGMKPSNVRYLVNTHSHGDHISGNGRFLEQSPATEFAAFEGAVDKLKDPLKYSVITRSKYPEYSPKPPAHLPGYVPDIVLKHGEVLAERLMVLHTPGHDTECISLLDMTTNTLFTGDSVQGFGLNAGDGSGIAFYKYLPDYRKTLDFIEGLSVDNLIASHDFSPFGFGGFGKREVGNYLDVSRMALEIYEMNIRRMLGEAVTDLAEISRRLLLKIGAQNPNYLFMTMYTVGEHIAELNGGH